MYMPEDDEPEEERSGKGALRSEKEWGKKN
jgi:hypothetical protein